MRARKPCGYDLRKHTLANLLSQLQLNVLPSLPII